MGSFPTAYTTSVAMTPVSDTPMIFFIAVETWFTRAWSSWILRGPLYGVSVIKKLLEIRSRQIRKAQAPVS